MIWSIFQVLSKQVITLGVFLVLTWLLQPEDFGILGMALVWITFLDSFSESGFSSALIQKEHVSAAHLNSTFVVNVIVGIVLMGIGLGIAGPAAQVFQTPILRPIIMVLSAGFLFNSLSYVQIALLQKNLNFRSLAIRDILASILGGVIGVIAAWAGLGVWSLVIQTLVTYLLNTLVIWRMSAWRPQLRLFQWQAIRDLWPYTSQLFIYNFFKFFAQNTEKFIISALLGAAALGMYTFAIKFTTLPITTFVGAIGIYLFPKFARLQTDRNSITTSYLLTNKVTHAIVAPICVIILVSAPFIVPLIWQDKWMAAIPILQILTLLAYAQALISPVGQLCKALNKPNWLLYWAIWVASLMIILIPLLAYWFNIQGAAWGITLVYCLGLPINYWLIRKMLSVRLKDIFQTLWVSFVGSVLAGLGFIAVMQAMILPMSVRLPMAFICAAILYSVILYVLERSIIQIIIDQIKVLTTPHKSQ